MKRLLGVRILAVFLCAVLQVSSVSYPVYTSFPSASTHTLAPFCQDLSQHITLPQRMGEAFESVLVSALRHWGLLKGWIVQHSVDIPGNRRTRPDLCFGATPAGMLESGKIIVEDVKLTRDPKYRYPDTFAGDKYTKFRYHYAALAIEEANRERMIKSLESFCHWITKDGVRVAHNSPELKDWGRIWTVIGTRINRIAENENYSADDELFARAFRPFYDRVQDVIRTGQLIDTRTGKEMSIEQLSFTLTNALEAYAVRKEVRIIHPALLTLPPSPDKLFKGLSDEEKARFADVELSYANVFTEWGHFFGRASSLTILRTLQFFIGMYLGLWNFDADKGMEEDIKRIRWTDREDEIVSFPLFRFGIKKKISKIENWFKTRNGADIQIGRISRGLRVGPRNGVDPSAETIVALGYNGRLSYFNNENLESVAKETVRLFVRERERLEKGGIELNDDVYVEIMTDVVRRLGLHLLYIDKDKKNLSESDKLRKNQFLHLLLDNWQGAKPRKLVKKVLEDSVSALAAIHRNEEVAYYGHGIIRNEHLNKSKKLMRVLGFEILKAETAADWSGTIDLAGLEVEKKMTGAGIVRDFCKDFRNRFTFAAIKDGHPVRRWQIRMLDEFEKKYMRDASGLSFSSIAQARMFLFYIGYLRDILLADEVEEAKKARLRKFSETSIYTGRHLSVHGVTMDYETGEIIAPIINKDGEYSEIKFNDLGSCIRAYDHIIEKLGKEAHKIEPLLEKFYADEEKIRSDGRELAAFAEEVLALRKGEPKNAENIMIRDVSAWILDACRDGNIDEENIGMQIDVLVNLLESRFAALKGMRFTFITRSSAIHRAANGRFEMIEELFDIVANSREPLVLIDEKIKDFRKNTSVPTDLKKLTRQIRAKLAAGLDRAGAVVVLDSYIERSELNKIDGFFYRYEEYADTISRIGNWAASYLKPRIEEAA